jgi:hypothetical protein
LNSFNIHTAFSLRYYNFSSKVQTHGSYHRKSGWEACTTRSSRHSPMPSSMILLQLTHSFTVIPYHWSLCA